MKRFEKCSCVLRARPPDPLRGRPRNVFSLYRYPGGFSVPEIFQNNLAIFSAKFIFFIEKVQSTKFSKFFYARGGECRPLTPCKSASSDNHGNERIKVFVYYHHVSTSASSQQQTKFLISTLFHPLNSIRKSIKFSASFGHGALCENPSFLTRIDILRLTC